MDQILIFKDSFGHLSPSCLTKDQSELSTTGSTAYNLKLKKDVLLMVVVLAHLGDLPMKAEITNTMDPASTRTPCCICVLQAKDKESKYTV